MKPHQIVEAWKGHASYPDACKLAARLSKQGMSPDAIARSAQEAFGPAPVVLRMKDTRAPLTIYGTVGVDIDFAAVDQMATALRSPVALRGALLPDAHPGYALPIGGVIALENAIAPYQVGVDIGCRMHLSLYHLRPETARAQREDLLNDLESVTVFGPGLPDKPIADHPILYDPRWQSTPLLRRLHLTAERQLGTSGSGNHFAELIVGRWRDNGEEFSGLLTHSGSRGVGFAIAKQYSDLAVKETARIAHGIPKNYEWLSLDSEAGQEYLLSMQLAGDFARANHEVIHDRFARLAGLRVTDTIQNHHNFAWVQPDGSVIHRKGATPADDGLFGIIPGSMGTASYIVRGLGNPASLNSASHGAGRVGSRKMAKETISPDEVAAFLKNVDVLVRGVALDESPQAYKDIESVIAYQVGARLVEPIAKMHPIAVIMAGGADE